MRTQQPTGRYITIIIRGVNGGIGVIKGRLLQALDLLQWGRHLSQFILLLNTSSAPTVIHATMYNKKCVPSITIGWQ